ncbi:hypothetical protein SERLADRAFT_405819 [Serpula lacrymans var. lacrymans S7.9]|uniref:Uncharacterized protein n=1 Tax=Serpula lacrymans var. lacrymans (strain S7.9) TaxID=578457 RepID=F8NLB2_SERL9|nr:uncharacterized protein SERLADRAFT_405819 [Serpula lacrymans var. lacrymans S7.9]EGO28160.1 hypothetical protein SERLADRAFT_405819 [Serpula lacrymans var. lacrymans S7.9]
MTSGGGFNFSFMWGWNHSLACRLSPRVTQHAFKGLHRNVKPEIFWSQLRKRWSPGFEILMDEGLNNGLYNPNDALERLVFHFIFIPWLQSELDCFADCFNTTCPRRNKNKILPQGHPDDIFQQPTRWDSSDFMQVRKKYVSPNHEVFFLVPLAFHELASTFLSDTRNPLVTMNTAWDVYSMLLNHFRLQDQEVLQTMMRSEPVSHGDGRPDPDFIAIMDPLPYRPRLHDKVQGFAAGVIYSSDEVLDDNYVSGWTQPGGSGSN